MQILQVLLPLKEPLVATLNGTYALTSETNVAKKKYDHSYHMTRN